MSSSNDKDEPSVAITLDQTVPITESFYPDFSLSKLFTEMGGALGLWLGVGAVQFCLYASELVSYLRKIK